MEPRACGTGPILAAHLLRRVDEKLIELLGDLEPREWDLPTVAARWTVRDVAAHLLDTPLRKLSMARDSCFVERAEIRSPRDLVDLVNRVNHEGVAVYRRLSPQVLIALMTFACDASARYHESLDPFAPAKFAVSWAGEEISPNWFDTARELTERWHHQQQIRMATNRPGIMVPELYHPVLDCFLRALPHRYRDLSAPPGAAIQFRLSGECGGDWFLMRGNGGWEFAAEPIKEPATILRVPQEMAWRLFTKGVSLEIARAQVEIAGDPSLAEPIFDVVAVIG